MKAPLKKLWIETTKFPCAKCVMNLKDEFYFRFEEIPGKSVKSRRSRFCSRRKNKLLPGM